MKVERAISIRQPYVELILRGEKRKEFRSVRTTVRGRVFLYASVSPADDPAYWRKVGKEPGELPTGRIVGTVEVVDCVWDRRYDCWAYVLARPRRIRPYRAVKNQPQPVWWRPKFR